MRRSLEETLARLAARIEAAGAAESLPPPPTWQEKEELAARLAKSGTPPRYQAVPGDLELPAAAAAWDGVTPWSVVFLGSPGAGKTWAATRLFGKLLLANRRWGYDGLWISAAALIASATPGSDDGGQRMERAKEARLLLLDDYLAERGTDFARERLAYLLSHRYDNLLATIVTSNATALQELREKAPRIASRLGAGLVIRMGVRDRRMGQRP